MHTTNLRKVGGSIMLAVPPVFLKQLHLQEGFTVDVSISDGHLIVDPTPKPHYTLTELLAASDYSQPLPDDDRDFINAPATGRELL